jgi:hypothetical protein
MRRIVGWSLGLALAGVAVALAMARAGDAVPPVAPPTTVGPGVTTGTPKDQLAALEAELKAVNAKIEQLRKKYANDPELADQKNSMEQAKKLYDEAKKVYDDRLLSKIGTTPDGAPLLQQQSQLELEVDKVKQQIKEGERKGPTVRPPAPKKP